MLNPSVLMSYVCVLPLSVFYLKKRCNLKILIAIL